MKWATCRASIRSVRHDEAHYIPHAVFRFNESWNGPDNREIGRRMLAGDPRVYMRHVDPGGREVSVDPLNIQDRANTNL